MISRTGIGDLAIVLGISWLVRVGFVIAIGDAHSVDVDGWERALEAVREGRNPYETGVLNWPPFWLQIIVLVDTVADQVDISFWTTLRIYLILAESVLVVVLYATLVRAGARRNAVRRALLVGLALNPVAILLVCQHGNSDVNVGLLVTLAVAALIAHQRSSDVVFWLGGCLLLGVGVLAKTVPFVLAPVLAPGARLAGRAGRTLGVALFLGPAALGLSVLMAIAPEPTRTYVIEYRSFPGFFGVQGLLHEVTRVRGWVGPAVTLALVVIAVVALRWRRPSRDGRLSPTRAFLVGALLFMTAVIGVSTAFDQISTVDVRPEYGTLFTLLVGAMVVWLTRRLWREPPPTPHRLFLLVAVIFMLVVAFGSGYGPQYPYWFMPALVATYVLLDDAWRRLLRIAYVIAGLTYLVEYGLIPWLGAWLPAVFGSSEWTSDHGFLIPYRLVLLNIPLFAVYLLVLAEGIGRLAAPRAANEPMRG